MKRQRLSLDIDPQSHAVIIAVVKKSQSHTMTEAVRRAFALFDLAIDHVNSGGKLVLRHKNGEEEVLKLL